MSLGQTEIFLKLNHAIQAIDGRIQGYRSQVSSEFQKAGKTDAFQRTQLKQIEVKKSRLQKKISRLALEKSQFCAERRDHERELHTSKIEFERSLVRKKVETQRKKLQQLRDNFSSTKNFELTEKQRVLKIKKQKYESDNELSMGFYHKSQLKLKQDIRNTKDLYQKKLEKINTNQHASNQKRKIMYHIDRGLSEIKRSTTYHKLIRGQSVDDSHQNLISNSTIMGGQESQEPSGNLSVVNCKGGGGLTFYSKDGGKIGVKFYDFLGHKG
jgi:hypothetical protein